MRLQHGERGRSHAALSVCVVLAYLTPWMKASKVSWKCVPNVEASKDEWRYRRSQRSRRPTVESRASRPPGHTVNRAGGGVFHVVVWRLACR